MATYLIGDLHGHYIEFERLLIGAGLCNKDLTWSGGGDHLWLMGDFFDRGASGIKCLELTMRLQQEAQADGGDVQSLLGNHELMILCAYQFKERMTRSGDSVFDQWLRWGGIEADFEGFTDEHAAWLRKLPAMATIEHWEISIKYHHPYLAFLKHGDLSHRRLTRTLYRVRAIVDRCRPLQQGPHMEWWR